MYSSVTHIFSQHDRDAIAQHIESTAIQDNSSFWTAGWPNEVEAALLDAVFSARATYGGTDNGVRRVISRWRAYRSTDQLDDLTELASFIDRPDDLAEILDNRQRVAGNSTTKAEAVAKCADVLAGCGVRAADQLLDADDQREAVTAIAGIGPKTWECALFLVGRRTPDSLRHFVAYVSDAVGRRVEGELAEILLDLAAESMGAPHAALEHAVWRYQRRIGPAAPLPSLSEAG
ncbi:hypothetical protein [Rhodococcus sovatensis]|uniref:DNA-3-methyladenine glycosylase III n=1 Tax=Rhodococcus sovatensis TaxID=1805840 RepID=A0ABZ2PKV0_9NOCA